MRTHSRARRLALTALCAGGTIGAAGLVAVPGQALAATISCSNVYASGSTLQTQIQQNVFTADAGPDGAFTTACTNTPSVFYNTDVDGNPLGGTGSGHGLTEFALQAPTGGTAAISPSYSQNGSWLDGFIGTDDPPSTSAMQTAASAAASTPEAVPVIQAPIAIVVHLPAGCTATKVPTFTNEDLSAAFANTSSDNIGWNQLLTDAHAAPKGCPSTSPTVQVRYDGSGTSFAFKQYLSQIDSSTWTSTYVSDSPTWPGTVSTTYVDGNGSTQNDQGSGGEAAAVADTVGSIGYVNTADASAAGFAKYAKGGSSSFWVKIQNNGTGTTGQTGANPATGTNAGNCSPDYSGALPSAVNEPDWTGVHVANPIQSSSSYYPVCTLTYDVAWRTYADSKVLAPDYKAKYTGETPAGVEATTRAYLRWELGAEKNQGQTVIPSFYAKLPSNIDTDALRTVNSDVGIN